MDFWHNNAPDPRNSTEKLNGYDAYVYRDVRLHPPPTISRLTQFIRPALYNLFLQDVVSILDKHNTSQPFFMSVDLSTLVSEILCFPLMSPLEPRRYLALHVTHDPIEAPNNWTALYANTSLCEARKVFQVLGEGQSNLKSVSC